MHLSFFSPSIPIDLWYFFLTHAQISLWTPRNEIMVKNFFYIPILAGFLYHFALPLNVALPAPCLGEAAHLLPIKNLISPQQHFLEHFCVLVSTTLMLFQKPCAIVDYFTQLYHPLPFPLPPNPHLLNTLFLIFSMLCSASNVSSFWVPYHITSAHL